MEARRFLALDGMRGVAALAVLIVHLGAGRSQILPGGYLAVDFFFCLSGFVLAHAYGEAPLGLSGFLKARAIRLYPLYLAGLALGIAAAAAWRVPAGQLAAAAAFGLLFLPAPINVGRFGDGPGALYPLDAPAWSLFYEIVANAVWFGLLRRLSGPRAAIVLTLCAALLVAAAVAYAGVGVGAYRRQLPGGLARVFYSFLAGAAAYQVWRRSTWRPALPAWACAAALVGILAAPVDRTWFDAPAVLLLMPPLVYLGACCAPPAGLSAALQRTLGGASYAIYALHWPVILLIQRVALPGRSWLVTAPLTLAVVVGMALCLDRYYDAPARRFLTRITAGKRAAAAPAAAPHGFDNGAARSSDNRVIEAKDQP